MKYLLDADWAISFLNGKANAVQLVRKLADEGIAMSIITCGEIYEGLLGTPSSAGHIAQFDEFTTAIDIISPQIETARQYATIRSHLRSQGLLLADNDLWIAATALAHDLILVSRDQHFQRIPGLSLYQTERKTSK